MLELLKQSPALSGVKIKAAYDGTETTIPRNMPHLFVGVEAVDVQQSGFGSYLGTRTASESNEVFHGMSGEVTLRFDCYLPRERDIALWDTILENLCNLLLGSSLGILRFWSTPPVPKDGLHATYVQANATLQTLLTVGTDTTPVTGFELIYRKEECNEFS